jgi:hypothetical protein
MAIKDGRLLELALEALENKRRSIEAEIAQLRSAQTAGTRSIPIGNR